MARLAAFGAFFLPPLLPCLIQIARSAAPYLPGDPQGDLIRYFYDMRRFAGESLRGGVFPAWAPWLMGGMPFAANPQAAVFYPWNWLHALMPAHWAIWLGYWAHLTLAAWAMDRLCRQLGASATGAAIGALAYGGSGFLAAHGFAGHLGFLCAAPWAPLCLAEWETLRRNPLQRDAWARGALFFGLQILAGAPQISLLTLEAAAFLALARSCQERGWRARLAPWAALAAIAAAGSALAAAQIVPALEFVRESVRAGRLAWEPSASPGAWPWANAFTLIFPRFLGDMAAGTYWGRGFAWEAHAAIGVLALAGAAAALFAPSSIRGTAAAYGFAALLGLLLAFGDAIPPLGWTMRLFPALSAFDVASRQLFVWTLCLPVAGALGWSALARAGGEPDRLRRRWGIGALRAGALLAFCLAIAFAAKRSEGAIWRSLTLAESTSAQSISDSVPDAGKGPRAAEWRRERFRTAMLDAAATLAILGAAGWLAFASQGASPRRIAAIGAMCLTLHAADMARTGWGLFNPAPLAPTRWPEPLAEMARQSAARAEAWPASPADRFAARNQALGLRLPMLWGYEPLAPSRLFDLLRVSQGEPPRLDPRGFALKRSGRAERMLGWRYLLAGQGLRPPDENWREAARDGGFVLWENPHAAPRAWIAPLHRVADWETIRAEIAFGECDLMQNVFFERAPADDAEPRSETSAQSGSAAKIVRYETNEVEIEYDSPHGGWLVLADRWAPGWQASVQGRPAAIERANGLLRAVPAPAGAGRAIFSYRPASLRIGLALSLAAAGFIVYSWIGGRFPERNPMANRIRTLGIALLALALALAACQKAADSSNPSKGEGAEGAMAHPAPMKAAEATDELALPGAPKFDYRVLAPPGQTDSPAYPASWKGAFALGNSDRFRFIMVELAFELTDQSVAAILEGPLSPQKQSLDEMLKNVFREKETPDLLGIEALESLREEIVRRMNERLGKTVVRHVYFQDYWLR